MVRGKGKKASSVSVLAASGSTKGLPKTATRRVSSRISRKRTQCDSPTLEGGASDAPTGSNVQPKRAKTVSKGLTDTNASVKRGIVDLQSGVNGQIYSVKKNRGRGVDHYNAMLALVDISKRHDKFIVLQLIERQAPESGFVLFERWGRTGSLGRSLSRDCTSDQLPTLLNQFRNIFKQKTGLEWDRREDASVAGKYAYLKENLQLKHSLHVKPAAKWKYWVDDGVDQKPTGWFDYDTCGNALVEQLYYEFQSNEWLSQRIVSSGRYSYLVDLKLMTQTNVTHPSHTVRHICRIEGQQNEMDGSKLEIEEEAVEQSGAVSSEAPQLDDTGTDLGDGSANIPVDTMCPDAADYSVVGNLDATLNLSDIVGSNNSNKFYRIQLLRRKDGNFMVWTRWGRVGETQEKQSALIGPFSDVTSGMGAFDKKFKAKTGHAWSDRNKETKKGKYELVLVDHCDDNKAESTINGDQGKTANSSFQASKLEADTKELVDLLFREDLYVDALKKFDIDLRRMPLGKLSLKQIERGVEVLKEIEELLANGEDSALEFEQLSSKFYTVLPHDFGRFKPPVINTHAQLQSYYGKCNVLIDIEKATHLMKGSEGVAKSSTVLKRNPSDVNYEKLNAQLQLVDPKSDEYDIVRQAFDNTKNCYYLSSHIRNLWRVSRVGERDRYENMKLWNHKLLWHGSHIGSIAAILSTGLRIMPGASGRVGRGIYLASECGKSQNYTVPAGNGGVHCMFLVQCALGRIHEIEQDDSTLVAPPDGFNSVRACGQQTPAAYSKIDVDGTAVEIPTGKPINRSHHSRSQFLNDEFLLYNEAQARLRYVITF